MFNMANWDKPNIRVQVHIEKQLPDGGIFRDALYLSPDEFDQITDEGLEVKMNERIDNHLKFVDEQSKVVAAEPTKEELEKFKNELESELAVVNEKLST